MTDKSDFQNILLDKQRFINGQTNINYLEGDIVILQEQELLIDGDMATFILTGRALIGVIKRIQSVYSNAEFPTYTIIELCHIQVHPKVLYD